MVARAGADFENHHAELDGMLVWTETDTARRMDPAERHQAFGLGVARASVIVRLWAPAVRLVAQRLVERDTLTRREVVALVDEALPGQRKGFTKRHRALINRVVAVSEHRRRRADR